MFVHGLDAHIMRQMDAYYDNDEEQYFDDFMENCPLDWDDILDGCFSLKEKVFGYSSAFEDLCDAIGLDDVEAHCNQIRDSADKVMKACFEHFGPYASLAEKAYKQTWRRLYEEYVKEDF